MLSYLFIVCGCLLSMSEGAIIKAATGGAVGGGQVTCWSQDGGDGST